MKGLAHAAEYLLFTLFRGFLRILPFPAVQRTGRVLGGLFFVLLPGRRAVALGNLRHAFPERTDGELLGIARGAFVNFGVAICEFLNFDRLGPAQLGRLMNYDANRATFDRLAATPRMVILTGHYGNWELAGFGTAALIGRPFLVVVKSQSNRYVDGVINRLRTGLGNGVVTMERSVRGAMAALHGGGIVALAADQSATKESDFVPFFGREVATFRGPSIFALRTGVPLVIVFTVRRSDGSYDLVAEEIPSSDLAGASEENVTELTRRHVGVLERHIRLHPDQWLWMHRRWKHLAAPRGGEGGGVDAS